MFKAKVILNSAHFEWVVFIHGFGGSSETWKKQIEPFSKSFNLLLLDMHSKATDRLTIPFVCEEIKATMDFYHIEKAHIISLSFGTMLALAFASLYPQRVLSLVMAGGIIRFNFRTNFLLFLGNALKNRLSYMTIYRFFAFIIMPRKNHKKSRDIFVREALKMGHSEFCRWLALVSPAKKNGEFIKKLNSFEQTIPILYMMGRQDQLFRKSTTKLSTMIKGTEVFVIEGSGHVCTIEKDGEFNKRAMEFMIGKTTKDTKGQAEDGRK